MPEQTDAWTAREDELLRRLQAKVQTDPQFGPDDMEALRGLIQAYQGWRMFGRGAKWIVYILAALAGGLTAWNTIFVEVRKWFGG